MNLAGKFKYGGEEMYLYLRDVRDSETFILISKYHRDDRFNAAMGGSLAYPVISGLPVLKKRYTTDYVIGAISRRKKTGRVQKFGTDSTLEAVINAIGYARSYRFPEGDITISEKEFVDTGEHVVFGAGDHNLQYNYETVDGLYVYLRVRTDTISFELSKITATLSLKGLPMQELARQQKKQILISSIKYIDFNALSEVLDMGWYRKDGVDRKKYRSVKSNQEFEDVVVCGLAKRIEECQRLGIPADVALDTETTGLNVYNLSSDNPDKDHCVAIPICWKTDESYVIFTDMEHFNNAENSYVAKRLASFFEKFDGEKEVAYWERDSSGNAARRILRFKRSDINLIGHNSGFDARVFYDLGHEIWFDQDTLQIAFNINPQTVRGSRKLKVLTRFFFHAETPELEDVLGKGNEDKYRYLLDEEAARIYGCADADFTLGCYYRLRSLMDDRMYYWYQKQDIPMINILSKSEYYGMRTMEKELMELAEQTRQNIEILKNLMYSYVGVYLQYTNDITVINTKYVSGFYGSKEEYAAALDAVKPDESAIYRFEFKPAQLKHVIFDIMKYPIKSYTEKSGTPALDKFVIAKLLKEKLGRSEKGPRALTKDVLVYGADAMEYGRLRALGENDVVSKKKADAMVLISADEFNSLKYPLALILQKYADLNKEYTSYYKPMYEQDMEGKIFKGYNLARIETRRISNPGQTMKGNLKALIRSYTDKHYMLDFDMSQIEYRLMLSLSGFTSAIRKMDNPESDYHTETASMVEGVPAHQITKKQRKNAKSVSFGVPYGLSLRSLCEKIFGNTKKENMIATAVILDKWKKANAPIIDLIEGAREDALREWEISDGLRDFMGMWKKDSDGRFVLDSNGSRIPVPVSKVENLLGFYRVFSLDGVDLSEEGKQRRAEGNFTAEESSIRRKAGNYPIQATAAEIFRIILIRFYEACKKYGIDKKIIWHMLIHDELLCSVEKDVHPFLLYKIIKGACMVTMKGHTKYFVGINIGDTWAETKDDSREAPVFFVNRIIKRYDSGEFKDGWFDHPWDFIRPYRDQYVEDRIGEVVREIQPDVGSAPLDVVHLLENFTNYTVRAYVNDYPLNGRVDFKKDGDDPNSVAMYNDREWVKKLESWALSVYGDGVQFKGFDGEVYSVHREQADTQEEKFVDYDSLFGGDFDDDFEDGEDSFWTFDEESASVLYASQPREETVKDDVEGDELEFDFSKTDAKDVNEITVLKTRFQNIKILNGQCVIGVKDARAAKTLSGILQNDIVKIGMRVIFKYPGVMQRWEKVRENIDLSWLDSVVGFINSGSAPFMAAGNTVLLNVPLRGAVRKALEKFPGNDYALYCLEDGKVAYSTGFSKKVSIGKLQDAVSKRG